MCPIFADGLQSQRDGIQEEIASLHTGSQNGDSLKRLAALLRNVVKGWRLADQKQRNRMARTLFNGVLVRDKQVVAVRPKKELEPFFKVSYECQEKSLSGDPDRIRTGDLCLDRAVC
jgi:hypothetical protein